MVKAEGIVLRTTDYGETNKIITLYTEKAGKIGLMARGAKKPANPLAAASQMLFHGQFMFKKGRGLGTLYQAAQITNFRNIKQDIGKTAHAALIVEMTDRLTEEGHPSSGLYHLLIETLLAMDKGLNAEVLSAIFEVKMMAAAGIEAELDGCLRCGRLHGPFHFSISGGGFLCRKCCETDPYAIPLSHAAERLLPLFKHVNIKRIGNIQLKKETIKEIDTLLTAYYDHHSGLRLKSKRFIDQLSGLHLS